MFLETSLVAMPHSQKEAALFQWLKLECGSNYHFNLGTGMWLKVRAQSRNVQYSLFHALWHLSLQQINKHTRTNFSLSSPLLSLFSSSASLNLWSYLGRDVEASSSLSIWFLGGLSFFSRVLGAINRRTWGSGGIWQADAINFSFLGWIFRNLSVVVLPCFSEGPEPLVGFFIFLSFSISFICVRIFFRYTYFSVVLTNTKSFLSVENFSLSCSTML